MANVTSSDEATAQAVARLVELRGGELYHALRARWPDLAAATLSMLISVAEQIREGRTMGASETDMQLVTDVVIGRGESAVFLQFHRDHPPLAVRSRPLSTAELEQLNAALQEVDQLLALGGPVDEGHVLLAALPVDLAAWLSRGADEARGTASKEEALLWGRSAPVVVAAELLLTGLRRLRLVFARYGARN